MRVPTDAEIPAILGTAGEAGARAVAYTMLRLSLTVAPVFREWLQRCYPGQQEKVEGRIRAMRGGMFKGAEFGERMVGRSEMAEQIAALFKLFTRRHGLDGGLPSLDCTRFRTPGPKSGQLWLF